MELNLLENILLTVYEENKGEFVKDDFYNNADVYANNKKIEQFHIESDIIKFIYHNHKNYKLLYSLKEMQDKDNFPIFILDKINRDISRKHFFDKVNNTLFNIENIGSFANKIFNFYLKLKQIYKNIFLDDSITVEKFDEVLKSVDSWNKELIINNEDDYDKLREIKAASLFNPIKDISLDIKNTFYFAMFFLQHLDTSITQTNLNLLSKEKIIILDVIYDKPYFTIAITICPQIENIGFFTIGCIFYSHTLESIGSLDTNVLFKLFYKPNLSNTISQDVIKYAGYLIKKISCVNILKYLTLGNNNKELNFYKTFRIKDNNFEVIDESKCTIDKDSNEFSACTYNGSLCYYENQIQKKLIDISKDDIITLINNFTNQELYKYMPICFIISINIFNFKKICIFSHSDDNKIQYNRSFLIEISFNKKIYIKYLDGNKEQHELTLINPLDITITKYQKIFFIVTNEDFDKNNPSLNLENIHNYGDTPLSIKDLIQKIEQINDCQQIIDPELKYIPIFASPNLNRNITGILLSGYFYFNQKFSVNYLNTYKNIHNFNEITNLFIRITFQRLILDIQSQLNNPDFAKYDEYLTNIRKEIYKISNNNNNFNELLKQNFNFIYALLSLLDINAELVFKKLLLYIPPNEILDSMKKLIHAQPRAAAPTQSLFNRLRSKTTSSPVKTGGRRYNHDKNIKKTKKKTMFIA